MKLLVIPDQHGDNKWKKYLNDNTIEKYDYVISLGDWFDSFHNDWLEHDQISNLADFLWYKKTYPEKVICLWGNHDFQYINYNRNTICSGFQSFKYIDIIEYLKLHKDEFQMVFQLNDCLFSHAGVSEVWFKRWGFKSIEEINNIYKIGDDRPFLFNQYDCTDLHGNNIHQSPLWIRPQSLKKVGMKGYDQVVGHTIRIFEKCVEQTVNGDMIMMLDNVGHECWELEMKDDVVNLLGNPVRKICYR